MKKFHKQSVVTAVLFLVLPIFIFSQDTTIKVSVPYSFEVKRTVSGTRTVTVTLPKPKPDTIRIHDTIFVNTCPPVPPDNIMLIWSEQTGTFQQFIDSAIKNKQVAVIDKDVTPATPIEIDGDLEVKGQGVTITSINKNLFVLGHGKHVFRNFNVVQTRPDGIAFFTRQFANLIWDNQFYKINIDGGGDGYASSRGGTATEWASSYFQDCIIKVKSIGISVFSQDGPYKNLHLNRVQISTDTTHCIYVHPNVSLAFDSLFIIKAGKLAMHQYSGSGIGYGTARYSHFKKVYTNGYAFEMTTLADGYIDIDSSQIAPYVTMGIPAAKVWATNTKFYNAGNGILLRGTLFGCSGGTWSPPNDTLRLVNCRLVEISMRAGGVIIANGTVVDYMSVADRGNNFDGFFSDSEIKSLQDGRNGNGVLRLYNTNPPSAGWSQPYRPEIIQVLNR